MKMLPGSGVPAETTIGRVSAMTLIIPIRQDLVPPLVTRPGEDGSPVVSIGTGPPVRPVENLRTALSAVAELVAASQPMGLNQVATIHFARWVIINGGRDLLFCANFDGSLDQYLTDFMVVANTREAPYMDIVWGTCVDYPGSEPTAFVAWARRWLIDTTLFFPTIPDLTIKDIAWLRQFRHLFCAFDRAAQMVPDDSWPPELLAHYRQLKTATNAIDLSVVI